MLLGFDFDGVIAYTDYVICYLLTEHLGYVVAPEDITTYHIEDNFPAIDKKEARVLINKLLEVEYTMMAPPVEGAFDFLRWYAKSHPINILTTRKNTDAVEIYMASHVDYNTYKKMQFISTVKKGEVCKELGITHFIDDYMKNIIDLANDGVVPVLFLRNWNKNIPTNRSLLSELIRFVCCWDDVFSIVTCERENML